MEEAGFTVDALASMRAAVSHAIMALRFLFDDESYARGSRLLDRTRLIRKIIQKSAPLVMPIVAVLDSMSQGTAVTIGWYCYGTLRKDDVMTSHLRASSILRIPDIALGLATNRNRKRDLYRQNWKGLLARDVTPLLHKWLVSRHRHRWRRLGDLRGYEWSRFSQDGEDGIISELLTRIGVTNRFFVEFGVETGIECNCARLVFEDRWRVLFMEGDPQCATQLSRRYATYDGVYCANEWITSDTIESLFEKYGVPSEFDILSIDIDGNDYWVWRAIRHYRPRIVIIEYNANYRPPERWVMSENRAHIWDRTDYQGASLLSLAELGRKKGYDLVGSTSNGVNAFFVSSELVDSARFLNSAVAWHYSQPRHSWRLGGHPHRSGPHEEI